MLPRQAHGVSFNIYSRGLGRCGCSATMRMMGSIMVLPSLRACDFEHTCGFVYRFFL